MASSDDGRTGALANQSEPDAGEGGCAGEGFVRNAASKSARAPYDLACAFRNAGAGVRYAFSSQRNMKIHAAVGVAALLLGAVLGISPVEWAVVAVCVGVVFAAECVNTAIESVVDLVSPDYHILAKHAKDAAAGAVLVCAAASVVVAALIFVPALASLF